MAEPPRKKQRRRLNYNKCQFCRNAKKACTPVERIWPQKCNRCAELELECSENSRAANSGPSISIQPSDQVTETSNVQKLHDLSLRVTWLRRLRFYEKASRAVLDAQRELWMCAHEPSPMRQMLDFIQKEEVLLRTALLDQSFFNDNPLAAMFLTTLLSSEATYFEESLLDWPRHAVSETAVDYLRKTGDIGVALTLQESLLLHNFHIWSEERFAIGLREYCDIYLETTDRLNTITDHEFPTIPPLHYLLTRWNILFPLSLDQLQLPREKDQLGRSLLHVALDLDILEDVLPYIQFDIASTAQDALDRWPIHIASSKSSTAAVEYLLENKADVNVVDGHQRSTLHYASASGNEGIIRLLLNKSAELDSKDDSGQTPLSWAAGKGHINIVQLLLEKGAEEDYEDDFSQTSLTWTAEKGHTNVVQLLLENSAEIESKDNRGRTPLWWATAGGHTNVIQLLLIKGAEIDSKDDNDQTPLWWAAARGRTDIVQFLLKKGANLSIANLGGYTPLQYALVNRHKEVVKLLRSSVSREIYGPYTIMASVP